MHWSGVGEFFAMGGYAVFVWGSVLACTALLLGEVVHARAGRRRVLAQLQDAECFGSTAHD